MARIYGAFTIQMDKFSPIHVMIMENCLPKVNNYELNHVFDIKGSKFSREVFKNKSSQQLLSGPLSGGLVLKDIDYERLKELRNFMMIGKLDYRNLMAMISKDSQMLRDLGIMDYSLLLSVRKVMPNDKRVSLLKREITSINPGDEDSGHFMPSSFSVNSDCCNFSEDHGSFHKMLKART